MKPANPAKKYIDGKQENFAATKIFKFEKTLVSRHRRFRETTKEIVVAV